MSIAFCEECRDDVTYSIIRRVEKHTLKGDIIEYNASIAKCEKCNSDIYVGKLMDTNLKVLYDAYRTKNDIISLEHICEIPVKYSIGKRPLSLLLKWGELTFTRYCDGDLPSNQYANVLRRLYNEPDYYLMVLESGKCLIKESTYKKSKTATQKLISELIFDDHKLSNVVKYILSECSELTNMALNKSLYYIQGFTKVFNDAFMFEEDCEAWVHGPVYRDVYQRYSSYGFGSIDIDNEAKFDGSCFSAEEKIIIDSVIRHLSCYSGKVLESFTHVEAPWIKTRGDLPSNLNSNRTISKDMISDYFKAVRNKYNMLSPADIKSYSMDMFSRI